MLVESILSLCYPLGVVHQHNIESVAGRTKRLLDYITPRTGACVNFSQKEHWNGVHYLLLLSLLITTVIIIIIIIIWPYSSTAEGGRRERERKNFAPNLAGA